MNQRPVALVTGGAKRLGAAMVTALANRGWDVWIHYHHSKQAAQQLVELLRPNTSVNLWLVAEDLSAAGGAESLVAQIAEKPPSLIIHSASHWHTDTAETALQSTWEAANRLHAWSLLVFARFLKQHHRQLRDPHLVSLLDARLRDRDPDHFSYAFAKRSTWLLTRYLADEGAPQIRVNGLAPGLILKADDHTEDDWQHLGHQFTPLQRVGQPTELLLGLDYLIQNRFVTGQILTIDGGRHLKGDLFGSL